MVPILGIAAAGLAEYEGFKMLGGGNSPPPPPPPPNAPSLAQPSIAEQGASARAAMQGAEGAGFNGTDVTGGQGAAAPQTTAQPTKSLLGG